MHVVFLVTPQANNVRSIRSFQELGLPLEVLECVYRMGWSHPSLIQKEAFSLLLANPPLSIIMIQSHSGTRETETNVISIRSRDSMVDFTSQAINVRSIKSFEELGVPSEVLQWVYRSDWDRPTSIQEGALPLLLANPPRDVIAQSQSETGKTVTSIILMLSRVNPNHRHPQVIYLTATTNLAEKTKSLMLKHATNAAVKTRMDQIVTETPDIVQGQIYRGELITANIVLYVMDDVDLLHQLYPQETSNIQRVLPPSCQQVAFSAINSQEVMGFAAQHMHNPITVRQLESLSNVRQRYVLCQHDQWEDKFAALLDIHYASGKSIIYCNTLQSANAIKNKMIQHGDSPALISEDDALNRFHKPKARMFITDNKYVKRGINNKEVKIVINFDDIPLDFNNDPDFETYMHRCGNTGQFGHPILVINFVDAMSFLFKIPMIEAKFHCYGEIKKLDTNDLDEVEKATQLHS